MSDPVRSEPPGFVDAEHHKFVCDRADALRQRADELIAERDAARREVVEFTFATWHGDGDPSRREHAERLYPGEGARLFPDEPTKSCTNDRRCCSRASATGSDYDVEIRAAVEVVRAAKHRRVSLLGQTLPSEADLAEVAEAQALAEAPIVGANVVKR